MKHRMLGVPVILLIVALTPTIGDPPDTDEPRFPFRFLIESVGDGQIEVDGVVEVDGASRTFDHQLTPFEFHCEAARRVSGHFESLEQDRKIRVRAYIPEHSDKKPVAKSKGRRIHLEWSGEPGKRTLTIWAEEP